MLDNTGDCTGGPTDGEYFCVYAKAENTGDCTTTYRYFIATHHGSKEMCSDTDFVATAGIPADACACDAW